MILPSALEMFNNLVVIFLKVQYYYHKKSVYLPKQRG